MTDKASLGARTARFFFMHVSGLVTIIVYFVIYGSSGYSVSGLRAALFIALALQSAYIALAWWNAELKQFDLGLWCMFAVGALAVLIDLQPVVGLFRVYSPAILFVTLGLTAALPRLLGYEPFTAYFMRRTLPRWQRKLALTAQIGGLMASFWTLLFFIAAGLCAYAPLDWRFTALYPNLLIFGVGMSANTWLPALYLKLFPPGLPPSAEAVIMGMPFAFDRRAARSARATIQFQVSGAEPGAYWLRIADGRCESFEGEAPAPDLTVYTPDTVWMRIIRGELAGPQALGDGLFRTKGDATILASLSAWFPAR
jgi:SCP-2 sterol transfer family